MITSSKIILPVVVPILDTMHSKYAVQSLVTSSTAMIIAEILPNRLCHDRQDAKKNLNLS